MRPLADMRPVATAALLAILSLSTAAGAQPVTPAPDPATPPADPEPAAVEPVAPAPEPSEPAAPPPDPPDASVDSSDSPNRPEGMSVGIGVGYSVPAQILEPNLASVRFRFASGLTIEPTVVLATSRSTTEVGPAETETEASEGTFATNLRLPLAGRGKIDLVLIGSAGLTYQKQAPDGPDNDTTTSTFALGWGLGLDYWPKQSWCLSATAMNPLLSYSRSRQEMVPQDQKQTNLSFGAIFDPSIFVMLHMFM
jgi:opacity protein-like surface antigen